MAEGGRLTTHILDTAAGLPGAGIVVTLYAVDGGIRRGTDVFKALALGAAAVGIGRPQAWGLAAYGQAGVESVLDIYARELRMIMRQAGTPTVASITRDHVVGMAPPRCRRVFCALRPPCIARRS